MGDISILNQDVRFLLAEQGVPQSYMEKLAATGISTLQQVALLDDDRKSIRSMLKDEWGFSQDADPAWRANAAAFICAWEIANTRHTKCREEEAQQPHHACRGLCWPRS